MAVRWADVLDILLIAFLIYQLLLMLKGTRAIPMGLGLFTLWFIYMASERLKLQTVYWLMNHVLSAFILIFVILFQDELRRFLTGLTHWVTRLPRRGKPDPTLEEVLLAVRTLADRRTGALIVLQQTVGLRPYIETGVALDARVSYDLLVALFHRDSPLHDGAVIVQGDRIAAASCYLPLSTSPSIVRPLGSRHRAAVGLSEESDAIVIVVSEETGQVSLAYRGQIQMGLSIPQLRALIEALQAGQDLGTAVRRVQVPTEETPG